MLVCQQNELRADETPEEQIVSHGIVKMRYKWNDWRPHFGYNPAHWSVNHRHSKPRAKRTNLQRYLVTLRENNKVFCSGIVINSRTVLTVKSCLNNKKLPRINMYFTDGTAQTVTNVSDAKDFTISTSAHLLSFLHLSRPLDREFQEPPPICFDAVMPKDKVVQFSWDKTYSRVRRNIVPQVPIVQCGELNKDRGLNIRQTDAALNCVENNQYTEECEKSFGLPYVWKGSFCGMNILGHNCPTASNADVYVRLLRENRLIGRMLRAAAAANVDDAII